ncbi:MAG: hypothetical protein HQK51_18515, partial [Oligoflexia bacterium]|nr:hypothetical protein [Oligoflexia bacterium]
MDYVNYIFHLMIQSEVYSNLNFKIIKREERTSPNLQKKCNSIFKLFKAVVTILKKIKKGIEFFIYIILKRPHIFLGANLYNLEFLEKEKKFKKYYVTQLSDISFVLKFNFLKKHLQDKKNKCILKFEKFIEKYSSDFVTKMFLIDIKNSLLNYSWKNVLLIKILDKIHRVYPCDLGIWGNLSLYGMTRVLFEYLRANGIKVIGGQHGNCYGDQEVSWHVESDYLHCDYFLTYGYTKNDLDRTMDTRVKNLKTKFLPFGKIKTEDKKNLFLTKKTIDILFPITNNISILLGGMARISPDKLTKIQTYILQYLDNLSKDLEIYVKPFVNSNYYNFSVFPVLSKCKNLKIVSDMNLEHFLTQYSPKISIIEYPSSPLYQLIGLD